MYINGRLDVIYSYNRYLEFGAFFDLSAEKLDFFEPWNGTGHYDCNIVPIYDKIFIVPSYGVQANLQILPFFMEEDKDWIDVYLSGKMGGYSKPVHRSFSEDRVHYFMGKLSPGIRLFPLKTVGCFYEFAAFKNDDAQTRHTFGLAFRF